MKQLANRSNFQAAETDMTPMLDIVFIMLIFFIVTTTFVNEAGLSVTKPRKTLDTSEPSITGVQLKISADGHLRLENRAVEIGRLVANIKAISAQREIESVGIKADQAVKHKYVVAAINEINKAGILRIAVMLDE